MAGLASAEGAHHVQLVVRGQTVVEIGLDPYDDGVGVVDVEALEVELDRVFVPGRADRAWHIYFEDQLALADGVEEDGGAAPEGATPEQESPTIDPVIEAISRSLSSGEFDAVTDLNGDGIVNGLDLVRMALLNNVSHSKWSC